MRPLLRPAVVKIIAAAALGCLLTGCTGPAQLSPPRPGAAADRCRELIKAVPAEVEDQQRRETEPPSPYTAAWGDPAITLACGVTKPAALNAASECFEVNGIGWFSEEQDGRTRFTTIGRATFVQVVVPQDYTPANPLVDLAPAIKEHVPARSHCV